MAEAITPISIHWGDIVTIAAYFALSLSVGIWSICRPKGRSVKGYFLAGRDMPWWPIGMSLFASNIGSEHFVGLAGTGSASGLAVIMFEWNAVILLLLLGWVFLPVYITSGIFTMPEYLARRFGGYRLRIYLSVVALVTYIFTNLSVDLYSGALFIRQALGWHIMIGVLALVALTALYTILGGLSTVIFTDALSVVIMIIGSVVLCIIGFIRIGGYTNLQYQYMRAVPDYTLNNTNWTCGWPRKDAWNIFRDPLTADYPSIGTIGRTLLGGLWYWCANQLLVQRALAAKNLTHAKAGCVLAGYLKLLPMFVMVLPGMISRALFPNEVACADEETCERVCGNKVGCSNIAYPKLVVELLPPGLRGLLLAVMIAAVISSLTSIFNSASTIFTMDIWRKIRPKSGDRELIIVGRVFIVILTGVSIAWIPIMQAQEGGQIFRYATTVTGYLGSPTCAMFVLAMFWARINEKGAFWGMITAQIVGIIRFVLDLVYPAPGCGKVDTRPGIVKNVHGYYNTLIQIAVAVVVATAISFMTKAIPKERLGGLTYWTRFDKPHYIDEEERAMAIQMQEEAQRTEDEEKKGMEKDADEQPKSACRRWMNSLLGKKSNTPEKVDGPAILEDTFERRLASVREPPFWKKFLNINAVIILTVLTFLYGFFH